MEDFNNFQDGRLPTLDFALEIGKEGNLDYIFYKKPMNSRWVTPSNTAASDENKYTWLSNDLVRRLLRISDSLITRELEPTINSYDEKLIFSGYKLQQRTQILERGISDYREGVLRLRQCGGMPHLGATQTLLECTRKKLIKKSTWYLGWDQIKRDAMTSREAIRLEGTSAPGQAGRSELLQAGTGRQRSLEVIAAVFIDRTTGGQLMKSLRENKLKLSQMTGYKIKIVEKNRITLSQSLVQRDHFVGWPYARECGTCKWKPQENGTANCNLHNVVYEGICVTCEAEEEERIQQIKGDPEEKEKTRMSSEYIGETSNSMYMRSSKHLENYRLLDKESFILKHHIKEHEDLNLGELNIRFELHKKHRTRFRRQISEVVIKLSRANPNIKDLNNKFEYTRCVLPDIGALQPQAIEEQENDRMDALLDTIREEAKRLPKRFIEGTRKQDFPNAMP